jgi:hypothetical protein
MQCRGHERMVVGLATIGAVSTITTKVESSNPVHGEVSSVIQMEYSFMKYILFWQRE